MRAMEALGYLGVGLVFASFYMKTMVPLRVVSIASNVILIAYGYLESVYPVLALHLALFPLNVLRLREVMQLIKQVHDATAGNLNLDWLKPFTTRRRVGTGETLFRKGDQAGELFFVLSGRLRLRESGIEVAPGAVVGELGLVAPDRKRTQTVDCVEDCELLRISYEKVEQLYFQSPKFGFYFLRLTSARLFENIARLENALAERDRALHKTEPATLPT